MRLFLVRGFFRVGFVSSVVFCICRFGYFCVSVLVGVGSGFGVGDIGVFIICSWVLVLVRGLFVFSLVESELNLNF